MLQLLNLFIDDIEEKLENDENIILQDAANLFRGPISVGGRLTLTNSRLIFQPHKINFEKNDEVIEIEKIKGVKKVRTLDFFDTSLRVTTENDDEYKFVLSANTRDKWFEEINSML